MEYLIRKVKSTEYHLLNEFLYEAIFIPEGTMPPDKSIIMLPELQVYVENFGKEKDDICYVAEVQGNVVGAIWARDMDDYGHIEDGVPSIAISLYKEYRGKGIGTALLRQLLDELRKGGYEKVSLSVQKANYAVKLYKKFGFDIYTENEEEYLMFCRLQNLQ